MAEQALRKRETKMAKVMIRSSNWDRMEIVTSSPADTFIWQAPHQGLVVYGVSFPERVAIRWVRVGPQIVATSDEVARDPAFNVEWVAGLYKVWTPAAGKILVPSGAQFSVEVYEKLMGAKLLCDLMGPADPEPEPEVPRHAVERITRAALRARQRQQCLDILKAPYVRERKSP